MDNQNEMSVNERKGFQIKCLNCGSTNCEIVEDGDYNYDEEWETWGYYVYCNDCGNDNR